MFVFSQLFRIINRFYPGSLSTIVEWNHLVDQHLDRLMLLIFRGAICFLFLSGKCQLQSWLGLLCASCQQLSILKINVFYNRFETSTWNANIYAMFRCVSQQPVRICLSLISFLYTFYRSNVLTSTS